MSNFDSGPATPAADPPPRTSSDPLDGDACDAFLAAMDVLGKRWNGAIIRAIGASELRFVDVRQRVPGITDALLTARLAELVGCGVVDRRSQPDTTRYRYALTPKGLDLVPAFDALAEWSRRWDVPATHAATRARHGEAAASARPMPPMQTPESTTDRITT